MHKIVKQSTVLFTLFTLLLVSTATPVFAQDSSMRSEERSAEKMAFDMVILRPAGLIGTAAGTFTYLISFPFSYIGGNNNEALESLVKKPAEYTFKRPLGDF
jgi:hypothetical protein